MNLWISLQNYFYDGNVEIDNNLIEKKYALSHWEERIIYLRVLIMELNVQLSSPVFLPVAN